MSLTFSDELIISKVSHINLWEIDEQRQFVNILFNKWFEININDQTGIFMLLKECFFRAMNAQQKRTYVLLIVSQLEVEKSRKGDLFELLGQILKYVDFDINPIVNRIISIETSKEKDQICLMNFLKYVWDECNEELHYKIYDLLKKQQDSVDSNLAEISADVLYTINSNPIRQYNSQFALVIPEFLTSATFLQQPIDLMRALYVLREKGIQGDIIDNRVHNYGLNHLAKLLEPYEIIIITSSPIDMVQKYYVDFRYCIFCETVNWLYNIYPNKKVVVCGAHGTVDNELLRKDIFCDEILMGENTRATINYLLEGTLEDDCRLIDYPLQLEAVDLKWYYGRKVLNGITYRQKDYCIMQISQGCPYQCLFCFNIYGHIVQRMEIDRVITQLKALQEAGVKNVFFIDQTFTLDEKYIMDLCQKMFNANIRIKWQCETRADLINKNLIQTMKEAGCTTIWLGFESFSQKILDANHKQLSKQQQLNAISILQEAGIVCSGFVMFGMVSDTIETIRETIDTVILKGIVTSRTANLCTVRIGTELFKKAREEGIINIKSFCHLEAYSGRLFNNLTDKELLELLQSFSNYLN